MVSVQGKKSEEVWGRPWETMSSEEQTEEKKHLKVSENIQIHLSTKEGEKTTKCSVLETKREYSQN